MVDVKQDISEDSKQAVRVKRELKIAPLNPSPVKKNLDDGSDAPKDASIEKIPVSADQQSGEKELDGSLRKPDFVDNGQYNIKIKKDAHKIVAKSKNDKSNILLVILTLIFVALLGLAIFLVSEDSGSSVFDPITDLFDNF